ncbi:4-oxalomesaconate tautomerase [Humibacillus xanthopallidus]|uniref:4-oxalomesaconate tautomerase n=1 Tax=Humibacillus xanthopallidus TaxID=412689 RepID=A0A543PUR6_9MICO|nr:4-oxalomesaconate tautomerase [Humibacillus xanthopallidus]TQN47796.1 4-oxalomesaconate tautomerase [Humibacillus xanthopallidus]
MSTPTTQTPIPCWFMRGGTSRGPFFRATDLPADTAIRDAVLLAVMGSPDPRQIDGLGGAHPLTSKVGIVSRSERPGVDLDFLFAQLQPDGDTVDTTPNCGNMLAAVVPFAVESGLFEPTDDTTTATVLVLNTGTSARVTVQTRAVVGGRAMSYAGDARIDGVPGTAAPVTIEFLDTAGSVAASMLPTGHVRDTVDLPGVGPVEVTCIDNGMPLVILAASAVGAAGDETPAQLNADEPLKERIQALRLRAAELMGLGDVTSRPYPKMTLVSPPRAGGSIATRSFIPHVCHEAVGVLAAVTVGTASVLPGTVAADVAVIADTGSPDGEVGSPDGAVTVSVEHPTGEFTVTLGTDPQDPTRVTRSALLRTARLLMRGEVLVPRAVWDPTVTSTRRTT